MRSDVERLRDILQSIAAIEKYMKRWRGFFCKNELVQSWVMVWKVVENSLSALKMFQLRNTWSLRETLSLGEIFHKSLGNV